MTKIVGTTDIGTGFRVTLAAGEGASISPGVTVGSTDLTAIVGSDSSHTVYVQGTVSAAVYGIQLGDSPAADQAEHVLIATGDSVSSFNYGVVVYAYASLIDNRGTIWSNDAGIGMQGIHEGTASTLMNSGTIEAEGIAVNRFGSEDFVLHNSGLITGKKGAFYAPGSSDILIDNTGTMVGKIGFGTGDDTYDGHAGHHDATHVNGGSGKDTLIGGVDPDLLDGDDGDDLLYGNAGDDNLNGGHGNDRMFGGLGNDTYVFGDAGDVLSEAAGSGVDLVQSSLSLSLSDKVHVIGNVENLTLLGAAVTGAGNALANLITGDAIANALIGLAGNDLLNGQGGADTLSGGSGKDTLTGGAGGDFFVFDTALNATTNRDVITDFSEAQGDRIRLSHLVFKGIGHAGSTLNGHFFHAGPAAADADDHIIYNQKTGGLYYDSNGDAAGGATLFAVLSHKPALTAHDFQVI